VGTSDANPNRPTFERVATLGHAYLPRVLLKLRVRDQDVDDVVQETLIEVGRALDHYDPDYHHGRRDPTAALRSWLWGFACRAAAAYHRHMRRELGESLDALADEPADEAPSSEQLAANEQRRRLLGKVLSTLPAADAEVLVPFHFAGMLTDEIAEEAGLHPGTVRTRLVRARGRFREAVERLPDDERALLQNGLLLLPLGLDRAGEGADPEAGRGPSSHMLATSALAALTLGVTLGATWARRAPSTAPDLPEVTPVQEGPTVAMTEATASVALLPAPGVTSAAPAVRVSAPVGRAEAGVEDEKALLKAARRARDLGAYDLALLNLASHERRFPEGALAQERERLRREVLAAMAGEAP
jgi:RNA polymerase sigma-70 factor, ECF subfamily